MDEARQEAARFDESIEGRLDLTGETIVTIDPVDARDFDDAISLEKLDNGHWRLGVHIADVSHFVRPRTALDREAHNRGTSVYLPDRVLPMLPELISNGLASLQPDKVRYTKSVFMEYTPEGVRTHTRVPFGRHQEQQAADLRAGRRLPGRSAKGQSPFAEGPKGAAQNGTATFPRRQGPRPAWAACTSWRCSCAAAASGMAR